MSPFATEVKAYRGERQSLPRCPPPDVLIFNFSWFFQRPSPPFRSHLSTESILSGALWQHSRNFFIKQNSIRKKESEKMGALRIYVRSALKIQQWRMRIPKEFSVGKCFTWIYLTVFANIVKWSFRNCFHLKYQT